MTADLDRLQERVERELGYERPPPRQVTAAELIAALELLAMVSREGQLARLLDQLDRPQLLAVRFSVVDASEAMAQIEDRA